MADLFCDTCVDWRFEEIPALRSEIEREGFGVCERIERMASNRTRALARSEDEFSGLETRAEYGCVLHEPR